MKKNSTAKKEAADSAKDKQQGIKESSKQDKHLDRQNFKK